MLPHFHSVDEAVHFVGAVDGRARTVLLVETASAASRVGQLCRIEGLDEIHFGLNDLSLDLGVKNHFAVLCSTLLEDACATLAAEGFPFAVGGIGRALDASLPSPPSSSTRNTRASAQPARWYRASSSRTCRRSSSPGR
jgi:citrate lyase beta subunit